MSYEATHQAFEWCRKRPEVSTSTTVVLLDLADRMNRVSHLCNPSLERIAKDCKLSKDTVRRSLRHLIELGVLVVHMPASATTSTRYRLMLKGSDGATGSHGATGSDGATKGLHGSSRGVAPSDPNKEVTEEEQESEILTFIPGSGVIRSRISRTPTEEERARSNAAAQELFKSRRKSSDAQREEASA